jgi:hypothetical protein
MYRFAELTPLGRISHCVVQCGPGNPDGLGGDPEASLVE